MYRTHLFQGNQGRFFLVHHIPKQGSRVTYDKSRMGFAREVDTMMIIHEYPGPDYRLSDFM